MFYIVQVARPLSLLVVCIEAGPRFLMNFLYFYQKKKAVLAKNDASLTKFNRFMVVWVMLNFFLKLIHALYGMCYLGTMQHAFSEHSEMQKVMYRVITRPYIFIVDFMNFFTLMYLFQCQA